MKGKSDANNQHYQFTLTLFLIILMMSYLLTLFLTDTTTIRTFGKKHSFQINKYRRLRFTREVTEEGGGNKLFPIVDDNIDFRGTKTNIASPILDKSKRKKKVTVSQMDSFAEDNDHDIFIDEFLDNMLDDLGTTSGNEAPVEESSEEEFIDVDSSTNENKLENVSSEFPDYDLIEMFLDLILMVKIDETLSPSTTPNNIPDGSKMIVFSIASSTIPSSSIVTTGNASRARVVNLSTKGIKTMIIKTSTPQPRLVQLITTPKMTISQHSTFTTTKFKVAASHVESTSPLSTQTSPTEISHLPIRKDPLPGNVTEESSTKPQVLVNPKTSKSSVSTAATSATVFTTTNTKTLTQASTVNATVAFLLNTSVDASVTTPSTIVAASTPRSIIAPIASLWQHQVTASDLRQKANRRPVYTVERKVNNRQRLQEIYKTRIAASTTQSVKLRLVKLLTTPTTISTHSTKVKNTSTSIHTESTTPTTPSFSIAAITITEEEKTPLLLATQQSKVVPLTSIPIKSSTLLPSTPRFTTTATHTANGSATRFLPTTITRERTLPSRKMENQEPFNSPGRKVKAQLFKNRNITMIAESISRPTTFKGISVRQRFKNYYKSKKTKSTPHSQTIKESISVESSTTVMGTSSTYSSFSVTESELSPSVTLSALRENKTTVFSTASVDDPNVVTSRPDSYENTTNLTEKKNDETMINNKTAPSSAFQTRVVKVVKEGTVDVITTASTFQPRVVKLLITTETPENRITTTETPENSSISKDSTSTSGQSNLTVLPIVKEGTVDVTTIASTFQPRVVKLLTTTETPENRITTTETPENRITTTETPENSSISRDSTSTTGQSNLTVLPLLETEQNDELVIPSLKSSVSSVFTAMSELNSSSTFPSFEAVPNHPVSTTTAFPFSTFPAVPNDSFEETKVQKMLKMENGGKVKAKELIKKYMNSTKDRPVDIFDKTLDLMEALTSEHVKGGEDFLDNAAVGSENGLKKLRSRTRVPHFKHKKFSRYYRNLKLNKKSLDIPDSAQKTILSSLREQLTASVLGNKKLRKKANHEPVFNPRRKINQERFKNYYKTKIAKMVMKDVSLLPSEVQTQLKNELEASLTENLEDVLDEIGKKENAKKKQEKAELVKEEVAKKKQEEALKSSLKNQLLKILGN